MNKTIRTPRNILAGMMLAALPLLASAQDAPPPAQHGCGEFNAPIHHGAHPSGMPPMGMQQLPPSLAALDLNESQQRKVFELMHAQAPAIFEKEQIVRNSMRDLQQLAKTDRFDAGKAKSLAEAHGKAIADMIYLHTETQSKVWALLNEAQRKQLAEQQEPHQHPRR